MRLMKRVVFGLVLVCAVPMAQAQSLADGMSAFEANDYKKAARVLKPLAERGDVTAQFTMGYLFYMGVGVKQDKPKAAEWYGKAAKQGDPTAMYNLGFMYLYGEGIKENRGKAIGLFRDAADKGQLLAMLGMGLVYETAKFSPPDYDRALDWYKRASREGLRSASAEVERLTSWMKDRARTVKGKDINLRAEPSTSASILAKISKPTRFYALNVDGDWVRVQMAKGKRTQGWLHKDLVIKPK